ncbi:Holliday junction resolvase RuvX [Candidatus Marinamargulisbacteria bacterium SCGC AAA071-K20]|nr:Holliday junction resolvase RuvX [Candidatus Marinamargulisbacteria bacterium SCGC AAA071-K20]
MKRILALDYGQKRVGVALSDPLGITAQSKPYLLNDAQLVKNISLLIQTYSVDQLIIGLPKDQHGGEGKKAAEIRQFSERLKKHIQIPIEFVDERFSTIAAEKHLVAAEVSRKKRKEKIDSLAAVFFLQGHLDKNTSGV